MLYFSHENAIIIIISVNFSHLYPEFVYEQKYVI